MTSTALGEPPVSTVLPPPGRSQAGLCGSEGSWISRIETELATSAFGATIARTTVGEPPTRDGHRGNVFTERSEREAGVENVEQAMPLAGHGRRRRVFVAHAWLAGRAHQPWVRISRPVAGHAARFPARDGFVVSMTDRDRFRSPIIGRLAEVQGSRFAARVGNRARCGEAIGGPRLAGSCCRRGCWARSHP